MNSIRKWLYKPKVWVFSLIMVSAASCVQDIAEFVTKRDILLVIVCTMLHMLFMIHIFSVGVS